jgi:hypothetical protein
MVSCIKAHYESSLAVVVMASLLLCPLQHDIIRDYTLAAHAANELQQRQRCFCQCLLDMSGDGKESTATLSIRAYASTLMHFHVRGAAITPLSSDLLVQSWLLPPSSSIEVDDIRNQFFQGVGSSNTNDLAIWFREKRDYWSAAQLWKILGNRTDAIVSKSQYLRNCHAVLVQIPAGTQPGVLGLDIRVQTVMSIFSDRQDERDRAIEWLIELADDPSQMHELTTLAKCQVLAVVGVTLLGFTNSKFVNGPLEQIRAGAMHHMQCSLYRMEHAQTQTGFLKWFFLELAFDPCARLNLTYTFPQEMHDFALAVLGEGGIELIKWHDS